MNYRSNYRRSSKFKIPEIDRGLALLVFIVFFSCVILTRLFYIQVLQYDHYKEVAAKEHYGYSELPARRGEIFIKDYASGDTVRVATNTTLNLLFADPTLIKDKKLVADRISPLIYDPIEARKDDDDRVKTETLRAETSEELAKVKPLTDDELYKKFYDNLLAEISQDIRPQILLSSDLDQATLSKINFLKLPGVEVNKTQLLAYPLQIPDKKQTAQTLNQYLEIPPLKLETILKGQNRYVMLQRKIKPEISAELKKIIDEDKTKNFNGLGLKEEYFRYYPEGQLAANILGFVTAQGEGVYGIEAKFNSELRGKTGVFQTEKDSIGRQITVGDSLIEPAQDGHNITLTIDRSIQMYVEKRLEKAVKDYRADSGQVIIMDPKTGNIIAMAHYPTFDPNNYSEVYEKEEIKLTPDQIKDLVPIEKEPNSYWLYRSVSSEDRLLVFKRILPDGKEIYEHYKNNVGPDAYQNKIVSLPYEPGSVFKIIAMSIGIDDKDVTANTSFNDPGYVEVEVVPGVKKRITNVASACTGYVNMIHVLANSCNTGMIFVAKKMGRNLFYNYIKRFGFGERTEIEFDNELPGIIPHFSTWADSELYTHAFGQGLTVTPIQMVTALAAIANKGVMMQPHIVESIEKEPGKIVKTEPVTLNQVVSEDTANTITSMMVNAVENGVAKKAALPDHFIAGKTGTSQTYKNGQPVSGVGTTIATVGGFAPIDQPKFVILAKLDRPRTSEWADTTTGYLFKDICAFLFDYYSIPPDKNIK